MALEFLDSKQGFYGHSLIFQACIMQLWERAFFNLFKSSATNIQHFQTRCCREKTRSNHYKGLFVSARSKIFRLQRPSNVVITHIAQLIKRYIQGNIHNVINKNKNRKKTSLILFYLYIKCLKINNFIIFEFYFYSVFSIY